MSVATANVRQKFKVIDVDTHYSEPHDLWTSRVSGALKEKVPQVKTIGDKVAWVIDGDKSIGDYANPLSSLRKDGTKTKGDEFLELSFDDIHPSSTQVAPRLQMMDQQGISAQLLYPNVLGFGGQTAAKVEPELKAASCRIYNDAVAELQSESGQRIFPMAVMPWWDIEATVKEVERAHAMGLRGIAMHQDPHNHLDKQGQPLPNLGDPFWYPLWEVCTHLDMPVNFHIGTSEQSMDWQGSIGWSTLGQDQRYAIGGAFLFIDNGRVIANLILSGLLDVFPGIKFVSVESGVGWIPFLMEALDYQYGEMVRQKNLRMKPSEYFKQNFFASFWFERAGIAEDVRRLGIDNVMFETDFPHPTCLYPVGKIDEESTGLTQQELEKVLSGNAARIYNISL